MADSAGRWDAIVVGAGHNALVAAAYLARGGLRTLVLERRDRVGGAADTSELAPGVRVPTLADTVGRLRPSVARDLDLRGHGLHFVAPDIRVFAPQPDGRAVALWSDVGQTVHGLGRWSEHDAARYADFDRLVRSLARFVADLGATTPPDIRSPRLGDALAALRLGRTYRGLGRGDSRTLARVLPMAVADFVAEAFETDALRATVAWRGVRHSFLGPWSAGSTAVLLADSAGNDGGAAGQTVYALGGPGALSEALASAARQAGAELRCGAQVVAVTTRDGGATGVALSSGEELAAPVVVSGLDPKRTLLDLVDPVVLGPTLGWRASNYRTPGVAAKVNLVVRKMPRFPAVEEGWEGILKGRILVAPGIDAIERAFDAAKYGRLSETPIVEATIPSLVDPSLVEGAKRGTHVVSALVQYAPYELREGTWDARRDEVAERALAVLEGVAPGISKLVTTRQVLTPLDLERDYGLSGGHPLHGEMALDQFFLWRPLLGHARYRMPVEGLYLAGAGAHPGGGITGGPGQNAAREILADRRRRR
ncbi:MAG TPA: NAD(P)/FAD-dependent oxidoreductase [Candidatus Limnocylindrales bacterium]|jgi:phytoene dehydrogenase-like protein